MQRTGKIETRMFKTSPSRAMAVARKARDTAVALSAETPNGPGDYLLEQARRTPVTIREFHDLLDPDTCAWRYDHEAQKMGLECWYEIQGIDYSTDGETATLWLGSTRTREVPMTETIYVQTKDIDPRSAQ